ITTPARYQQDLSAGVLMPVISCSRFKSYIADRTIEFLVSRDEHAEICRSDEILAELRRDFFSFGKNYALAQIVHAAFSFHSLTAHDLIQYRIGIVCLPLAYLGPENICQAS